MSKLEETGPSYDIGVRVAYKVNTGNFENMDVEFSLSTTVKGTKQLAIQRQNELYELLLEKLVGEVQEVKKQFQGD